MNILIVGFDNYQELDSTMQKLIDDSQCFLFNVICGGQTRGAPGLAEQWAIKNGAPVNLIIEPDVNKLMRELAKQTDYLIMKISGRLPQVWKNFMMRFKETGKHGTIIR